MNSLPEPDANPYSSQENIILGEGPGGALAGFIRCSERVELLVRKETGELRACAPIDFEPSNLRKSRALMDFVRASRAPPAHMHPLVIERLQSLRTALDENSSTLEQHLRAAAEIADLMTSAIRAEESDGTYSIRLGSNR
jgi:hypothetical protein